MADLLERLTAILADRYAIEQEIGRGGMAVVFRATDRRHHRKVAIKVLRPELSAAVGADRFLQEIEVVAGLTHPHILPLFDSGEADGLLYYIMPYVEGESLRQRLDRVERLPVDEAIWIAKEVANALDHAHRHGLVHRDVKPGNILLTDGHAFVTDFGIARALDAAGGDGLTRTGLVVGTPAYMSPEQASGDGDVGARGDQYALGCVLHEMLAGRAPFVGSTPQAIIARHMTQEPPPIRQARDEVPPSVEEALTRALAKEPEARFPSCEEFALALAPAGGLSRRAGSIIRRLRYAGRSRFLGRPVLAAIVGAIVLFTVGVVTWAVFGLVRPGTQEPVPTAATDPSSAATRVAILYFEDLSPDGSLAPHAAGFTKGLIRRLNAVQGLAVPSYTAVRSFRGTALGPDSLAAALSVEFLAEGAVLPTSDGLQVEVDLVDPATGLHVGFVQQRATLPHQLAELLEAVTDSLALALRPELGQQVRLRELRMETSSDRALELVWRAEELASRSDTLMELEMPDRDGAEALLVRADSLLSEAQALDPSWTEPLVQRGWVAHRRARVFTDEPQEYGLERLALARDGLEFANRAIELRPESAEALELRGTIRYGLAKRESSTTARDELLAAAEEDLRNSVAMDGQRATAWRVLSDLLNYLADFEGAEKAFSRALQADRFLDDAESLISDLVELNSNLGDYDEAWRLTLEGRRRWPRNVVFPYTAVMIMASDSERADVDRAWAYADTVLQTMQRDRRDQFVPVLHADISAVLALAGLEDSARAVLQRAITTTQGHAYPAYNFAHAYLVLGDTTEALRWLEVDLDEYPGARARRASEPWFEPLHGHPEFEALVAEPGEATGD